MQQGNPFRVGGPRRIREALRATQSLSLLVSQVDPCTIMADASGRSQGFSENRQFPSDDAPETFTNFVVKLLTSSARKAGR